MNGKKHRTQKMQAVSKYVRDSTIPFRFQLACVFSVLIETIKI
jgi:hypothetical protein